MTRELQSDAVSSVDRSSSGIAHEQFESQLQHPENRSASSIAMASDAVSPAAETSLNDDNTDEPSSTSNGTSSRRHEPGTSSGVSID